jgi:hypothetical protein
MNKYVILVLHRVVNVELVFTIILRHCPMKLYFCRLRGNNWVFTQAKIKRTQTMVEEILHKKTQTLSNTNTALNAHISYFECIILVQAVKITVSYIHSCSLCTVNYHAELLCIIRIRKHHDKCPYGSSLPIWCLKTWLIYFCYNLLLKDQDVEEMCIVFQCTEYINNYGIIYCSILRTK